MKYVRTGNCEGLWWINQMLYLCQTPHPQHMTATPALLTWGWSWSWPVHRDQTLSTLSPAPAAQWGSSSGPEQMLSLDSWSQWSYIERHKSNPLSHPNETLAPQARHARVSGENLNYVTLAPQARKNKAKWWNFELLAESLVWHPRYDRCLLETVEQVQVHTISLVRRRQR